MLGPASLFLILHTLTNTSHAVAAYMRGAHRYAQETNLTRRVTAWEDRLMPVLRHQHAHPKYDIHEYGSRLLDTLSLEVAKNVEAYINARDVTAEDGEGEGEDGGAAAVAATEGGADAGVQGDGTSAMGGGGPKDEQQDIMAAPFIHIAAKQQASRYEVCRLFLSMLQLANDKNVELRHETLEGGLLESLMGNDMDAIADRLTDSLKVRLLSKEKAKAVEMVDHPAAQQAQMEADAAARATATAEMEADKAELMMMMDDDDDDDDDDEDAEVGEEEEEEEEDAAHAAAMPRAKKRRTQKTANGSGRRAAMSTLAGNTLAAAGGK